MRDVRSVELAVHVPAAIVGFSITAAPFGNRPALRDVTGSIRLVLNSIDLQLNKVDVTFCVDGNVTNICWVDSAGNDFTLLERWWQWDVARCGRLYLVKHIDEQEALPEVDESHETRRLVSEVDDVGCAMVEGREIWHCCRKVEVGGGPLLGVGVVEVELVFPWWPKPVDRKRGDDVALFVADEGFVNVLRFRDVVQDGDLVVSEGDHRAGMGDARERRRDIISNGGLVNEVVGEGYSKPVTSAEDEADEEEVIVCGDDLGLHGVVIGCRIEGGRVDAHVGDERRASGGAQGDLDFMALPCFGGRWWRCGRRRQKSRRACRGVPILACAASPCRRTGRGKEDTGKRP